MAKQGPKWEHYVRLGEFVVKHNGPLEEALAFARKAIEVGGDRPTSLIFLIDVLQRMGRLEEALSTASAGAEKFPRQAGLWESLTSVQKRLGNAAAAAAAMKKAVALRRVSSAYAASSACCSSKATTWRERWPRPSRPRALPREAFPSAPHGTCDHTDQPRDAAPGTGGAGERLRLRRHRRSFLSDGPCVITFHDSGKTFRSCPSEARMSGRTHGRADAAATSQPELPIVQRKRSKIQPRGR